MHFLTIFDLIGTFVFSVSGTLAASDKKFDLFGAIFAAFVTAVGGGSLRDILLGAYPLAWVHDLRYLGIIVIAVILTFLFKKHILPWRKTLFLFDTIGIGVFTILGMQKALSLGIHPIISIMMGTISAVFGGVIRDTFSNEVPLIFRKEIYATACIIGASLFLTLSYFHLNENINITVTISTIILIRLLAIKYKLSLPRLSN